MISTALEYAKRLRELNIPGDIVGQTGDIFKAVPQVKLDFESPAVALSAKHNVIEKVFPLQIRDFLKEWQRVLKKRLTKADKELAKISKEKRNANIEDLKAKNNTRVLQGLAEDFMDAEEIEELLEKAV